MLGRRTTDLVCHEVSTERAAGPGESGAVVADVIFGGGDSFPKKAGRDGRARLYFHQPSIVSRKRAACGI